MSGELIWLSVPSAFITSPPEAHTDGHSVKTLQPPQLPPK
jgi:hypothetical protein